MRVLWPVLMLLGLAACSSAQGVSPLTKAIYGQVTSLVRFGEEPEAAAGPSRRLTRAKIEATGIAMMRAQVGETSPQTLMAVTDNGGYVNYATQLGQTLTMRGTLVTATRGIESDLLSTQPYPGDPIAFLTPIADWPKSVRRVYHLPDGDTPAGRIVDVTCSFIFGDTGEHMIIEVVYPMIQVLESCQGAGFGFENAHLADTGTGQVWTSRQWIGFQSDPVYFDVLEPYTE